MKSLLIKNGLTISKNSGLVTDIIYEQIKKDLVVINPSYLSCIEHGLRPVYKNSSGKYILIPKMLNFMKEYPDRFELPAGYYKRLLELLGQDIELEFMPCASIEGLPDTPLNIELFDYQKSAVSSLLDNWCGILSSPAASGKTVMAIDLIIKLKIKTLWLVHLDRLVKQAVKSFSIMTGCTGKDIGIVGHGTYNIGNIFTAAIIDTARKYSKKLSFEQFGLVIVDECHRTPTKKTYDVLMKLSPSYLYGLSATPYRTDGLDKIMKYMLGQNVVEVDRDALAKKGRIVVPEVNIIYTNIFINTSGRSLYCDFINTLTKNDFRNKMILHEVLTEVIAGNVCLVLSERVNHCKCLYDMLSQVYPHTRMVSGKTKKEKTDLVIKEFEDNNAAVLITPYQFLGEGFDLRCLNRLFFCTPFKDSRRCEQAIGRIQRTYKHNKNKTAKLYDFVDNNRVARIQLDSRIKVYKTLGCKIFHKKSSLLKN